MRLSPAQNFKTENKGSRVAADAIVNPVINKYVKRYPESNTFDNSKFSAVIASAIMATKKFNTLDDLSESWVELNSGSGLAAVENEYIRLLREAQRESRDSSVRHSRASSVKGSPKSPPNSPNLEPSTEDELKGVYINCWRDDSNDWVWEWSSRPDQMPPKDWRFKHPQNARGPPSATSSIEVLEQQLVVPAGQQGGCLSVRRACLFSRGALCAVLITNLVSLLLGAGIGVWLSRRGMLPPRLIILN